MVQYPTSISADVLDTLISMIRNKSLDKSSLALAIWNVQGYVQQILLTDTAPKIYGDVNANPSDEEVLPILESLKSNVDSLEEGPHISQMGPISAFALRLLLRWLINTLVSSV